MSDRVALRRECFAHNTGRLLSGVIVVYSESVVSCRNAPAAQAAHAVLHNSLRVDNEDF